MATCDGFESSRTGLIKLTGNFSDLLMAHSSWFMFANTNRVYKFYSFGFSDPSVAARSISFSSYPGFLVSLDDFYLLSRFEIVWNIRK